MKFLNVLNYLDTPQTGYEPTTLGFVLFASAPQTGYEPRTLGILSFVYSHPLRGYLYQIKSQIKSSISAFPLTYITHKISIIDTIGYKSAT